MKMKRTSTKYAGLALGVALAALLPACTPSMMVGRGSDEGRIAPRPPGAMYPNWEYFCHIVNMNTATDVFNEAGAQGWEMVTVTGSVACFKRPLAPPGYAPAIAPPPAPAPVAAPPPAPAS